MLITSVTTSPPCDLPAIASAVADAAAALLALGVAQASSGGAVSPRLRTHGGERQQQQRKPVRVAVSGGASAWCGATYDGGPPTPTSALSPSSKRRVSSWSKPQSRVDVQAGAIKVLLETTVSGPTWTFEGSIRAALGNNPDTSKGLRKLRSDGVLVRRGQGGRNDPYAYMLKREWLKLPEALKKVKQPSGPRPLSLAATESDSGTCDTLGGPPTPALPLPPSAPRNSDVPLVPGLLPVAPGQQPWAQPHLGLCGGWHSLSLPIPGVPVFAAGHPGAVALLPVGSSGAPVVGMAMGFVSM